MGGGYGGTIKDIWGDSWGYGGDIGELTGETPVGVTAGD